jgi:hypothetical protein
MNTQKVTAYGYRARVISWPATKLTLATGISSVELEMDINRLAESLGALPFRQAVWLFPFATALHFLEEAPHFADWASKYALPGYTRQRWRRIDGLGIVFAIAFCALASIFPNRYVVFLFFALCLSESVLNGLFHVGATAFSGVYCPGLITALVLYPPLFWYLSQIAYRESLLTMRLVWWRS